MSELRPFVRPIRVPESVPLETAEPPVAHAGEEGKWTFTFTSADDVAGGWRLVLHNQGGRNNKHGFGGVSARAVSARTEDGSELTAIEQDGVVALEVPESGLSKGARITVELQAKAATASLDSKFLLLMPLASDEAISAGSLDDEAQGRIAGACLVHVTGAEKTALAAHAPSVVKAGEEVSVLIRPEDRYGNVACEGPGELEVRLDSIKFPATRVPVDRSTCCRLEGIKLDEPGVYRLEVREPESGLTCRTNPIRCEAAVPERRLMWGYIHGHTEHSDGIGNIERYFEYMRDECGLDFGAPGDHDHLWETPDRIWARTKRVTSLMNEPGRFTTLLGYEWAKWRKNGDGDRNVYFLDDERPMYRSDEGHFASPPELFDALKGETAMVIAHHTADAGNFCDWKDHDPTLERLVEIYSIWGNSERAYSDGNPYPVRPPSIKGGEEMDAGEVPDGFVQRALALGCRLGFTAGGDDHNAHAGDRKRWGVPPWHYPSGLMAVQAAENTRAAIWDAMWHRRCYGTTGARIVMDFRLAGEPMGSAIDVDERDDLEGRRTVRCQVHGTAPIERIDVVRNNQDAHTVAGRGNDVEFEWTDTEPLSSVDLPAALHAASPFTFYYVRVTQSDGEMAWGSPIWLSRGAGSS